ncbi:serine/threonine protein kinase, partial [Myxococcota bacterium]|nr:serine/threonine protein kinase [Myxococcota bacterium]
MSLDLDLEAGGVDPWIGRVVGGRYRLVACIGRGAASKVYRAEHLFLSRAFALKLMDAEQASDPVALRRFLEEGRVAGRLGHPDIVEWTDMGFTDAGLPFLVMELLHGRDLRAELDATGPMSAERAAAIGARIAGALAAAHGAGIVHRDLKTTNVFISADGEQLKVLDFGMSKVLGVDRALTRKHKLVGTPQTMAPEQILAPDRID